MENKVDDIVGLIEEQLKKLVINEGITDQSTFDDNLLNQIKTKLNNSFVDEKIVREEIWIEAFEAILHYYKTEEYKNKTKLEELTKISISILAKSIKDYLQNLPENYEFIFPLPKSDIEISAVQLTENIEILSMTDTECKKYFEQTEAALRKSLSISLVRDQQPIFSKGTVVLRISGIGYVSKFGLIRIVNVEDPSYIYKVVLGTYIATSILKRNKNIAFFPYKSEYRYAVYKPGEKEEVRNVSLSTDDTDYIFRMDFDTSKFAQSKTDNLLNSPPIFERTNKLMGNILRRVKVKGKDIISRNQQSVKNGAFWLYEAIKTNEEHNRTIYSTTAFDALVGSRSLNEDGKGRDRDKEHKADLIAQSIGSNIYESNRVRQQIINLFKYRNEIVHGEKPIYTTEKYEDETTGRTAMCIHFLLRYFSNKFYFISGSIPELPKKN